MRHVVDPRQIPLFDVFADVFAPLARKRVDEGWPALLRHSLLHLLPVRQLGRHFDPHIGRPSKELYSMAGLMLVQEFHHWTNAEAVEAYLFRTDVQFALNLEPGQDELCERTWERYRARFLDDGLAQEILDAVTGQLVAQLDLKIDEQRLDSTHVFSNMARFGRTRLLAITSQRFLKQVARHFPDDYQAVPVELRRRYEPSVGTLFSHKGQTPPERERSRQQAAEDLHALIVRFAEHAGLNTRPSYRVLVTVFEQQCELIESRVKVRAKSGVSVQNSSDLDATYDAHKGVGYKAQLSETCSAENDVQLVLSTVVQTASARDSDALPIVLKDLKAKQLLPEAMTADMAYAGDGNVQTAAAMEVELVAPVAGQEVHTGPDDPVLGPPLTMDDFAWDERTGAATACPAGKIPLTVLTDPERDEVTIEMSAGDCETCPFQKVCPVERKKDGGHKYKFTNKQRRVEERRREQATPAFRERYAKRSGIESTNSGLKRRMGFGRLRVRGRKAVTHALTLKIAGWNLLRAAEGLKKRARKLRKGLRDVFWPGQGRWYRRVTRAQWLSPQPSLA